VRVHCLRYAQHHIAELLDKHYSTKTVPIPYRNHTQRGVFRCTSGTATLSAHYQNEMQRRVGGKYTCTPDERCKSAAVRA
jgi:hypothetical protein